MEEPRFWSAKAITTTPPGSRSSFGLRGTPTALGSFNQPCMVIVAIKWTARGCLEATLRGMGLEGEAAYRVTPPPTTAGFGPVHLLPAGLNHYSILR